MGVEIRDVHVCLGRWVLEPETKPASVLVDVRLDDDSRHDPTEGHPSAALVAHEDALRGRLPGGLGAMATGKTGHFHGASDVEDVVVEVVVGIEVEPGRLRPAAHGVGRISDGRAVPVVEDPRRRERVDDRPDLRGALLELLTKSRCNRLILNLSNVPYMDSSAIAVLVEMLQKLRKTKGSIALTNLQPRVKGLLEIARLNTIFTLADTDEDALKG